MSQLTLGAGRGWPGHQDGRAWAVPAASPNPARPKPPDSTRVVANPAIPLFIDLTLIPSGSSLRYLAEQVDNSRTATDPKHQGRVSIRRMFQEQTGESGSTDRIDLLLDERYRATRETATGLRPRWPL